MNDTYFQRYIQKAPKDSVVDSLVDSAEQMRGYLSKLTEEQWNYRYADGKWSIKEMVVHIIDTERIMVYRALRFARGDKQELPGFDQDIYVEGSEADKRKSEDILNEYLANRMSTLSLFRTLSNESLDRSGSFSSQSPMCVRDIGKLVSGHEIHHLDILKERYYNL